ncbi:hypothetical protein D3C78_944280 [compost metagenome]
MYFPAKAIGSVAEVVKLSFSAVLKFAVVVRKLDFDGFAVFTKSHLRTVSSQSVIFSNAPSSAVLNETVRLTLLSPS